MFNVPHEDEVGRFNQIILVYPKGTLSAKMVNNEYSNRLWKKL